MANALLIHTISWHGVSILKFAFTICSLLFLALTIVVTFQYEAFSVEKAEQPFQFTYDQEVEVTVHDGKLNVVHHLSGLPSGQLSMIWPADSIAMCADGSTCERLTPDFSTITEGEARELSVSYEIDFQKKEELYIRSMPFAKIRGGEVGQSVLHLTDRTKSGGTWLTGLPLIGQKTMSFVDYFLFAGDGPVQELYWQTERLSLTYKNPFISLYSEDMPPEGLKKMLDAASFPQHVDVIVSDQRHPHTNRVLFIREGTEDAVKRDLTIATLQSLYKLKKGEDVLLSVLANLLTDQLEGNSKAKAMTGELKQIPEEQMTVFLDKLWDVNEEELNAPLLDSYLSVALNEPVSFFGRNVSNGQMFPLVVDENRPVHFEGNPLELDVIKVDGKIHYALPALMEALGYTMREGEHGLYLDNGLRSFRFPVDEPFYVLNDRRYDAPEKPIVQIAGNYYIEDKWLILLFLLDVQKEKEQINIERIDGF